jgi:hypothetical protein
MAVQKFTHLALVYFNKIHISIAENIWYLLATVTYLTWNNRMFGPGYFMSVFHRLTTLNSREGYFIKLDLQYVCSLCKYSVLMYSYYPDQTFLCTLSFHANIVVPLLLKFDWSCGVCFVLAVTPLLQLYWVTYSNIPACLILCISCGFE